MAPDYNADDDFDWEAAVAEIDKACSRVAFPDKGGIAASCTQSKSFHQKTLDSFIRGGKQRSGTPKICGRDESNGAPDSYFPDYDNQLNRRTDFKDDLIDSTGDGEGGCDLPLDLNAAKTWIYPANVPRRSYQFNMAKTALFTNTLVCLPTGLGKTLIAAVVMYNFFRWFPTGKIVFTAPSRPLVVQQIEACHKVAGIPQEMAIDMTGQMNPPTRAEYWKSKRVFFVTPQVLEKDIQSGRCEARQIVCLVVDEAHRATGNYSYCVVLRELSAAKVQPRILALTATPGSKQITIQAVVDNLQISCLEYRDEHDPDISQYTHNRKVELIEVPMNAEAIEVKDLFIEVMQPIVHKLCYLGVFYSREVTRLTPFEFLTARDKFRESPPPALQQSKYPEVETYFGLAITLYHIFKLLFTHGMRPAFEMLQQKLEQGVLKKLGANQKLLQVQSLMKEIIGHGAPSPKLDKVVDIINEHFRVHHATETRVIIFTNYRESVKDIMEKLTAACEGVKAMEFIGQSSGKSSKGQTQKIQQAVLQMFRGGSYNTIVATSIAEEGLDIMEVDLVICFDANISPLRMIQRMGRTGRKRDGRVVVLASGGSEIQGYLKKKSKSKALGKHMIHGGLQSFNFHPSPRMIPHSIHTAVEVVELSIKDFVPRALKTKERDLGQSGMGGSKLTKEKLEIVKHFRDPPGVKPWIPSLIAFPRHQSIPTPVHKVRHSKRTCMLIDALRTLQELSVQFAGAEQSSRQEKVPRVIGFHLPNSVTLPMDTFHETNSIAIKQLNLEKDKDWDLDQSNCPFAIPQLTSNLSNGTSDGGKFKVDGQDEHHEIFPSSPCSKQLGLKWKAADPLQETGFCKQGLSMQVELISQLGFDLLAYPPLPSSTDQANNIGKPAHKCSHGSIDSPAALEHETVLSINKTEHQNRYETISVQSLSETQSSTIYNHGRVDHIPDFVAATPDGKGFDGSPNSVGKFIPPEGVGAEELSPRLAEFALHGVVPSSPIEAVNSSCEQRLACLSLARTMQVPTLKKTQTDVPSNQCTSFNQNTPRTPLSCFLSPLHIQSQLKPPCTTVSNNPQPETSALPPFHGAGSNSSPSSRSVLLTQPMPLDLDCLNSAKQLAQGAAMVTNMSSSSTLENSSQHPVKQLGTPNESPWQIPKCKSNSEDWEGVEAEVAGSVQQPRKLKRLRKACEKFPPSSSEIGLKTFENVLKHDQVGRRVHHLRSDKQKRASAVRAFIDEEAEVSSDEDSSDTDNSENEDEGGSLQDFIDTAMTQHLNGPVDMMAVYRRSLLTPLAPGNQTARWMNRLCATPSSGATASSSLERSSATENVEDVSPGCSSSSFQDVSLVTAENTVPKAPSVDWKDSVRHDWEAQLGEVGDVNVSEVEMQEDPRKPELRKRKLSFQISPNFEDDVFEGVDLDALEAEAAEISRLRSQSQVISRGENLTEQTGGFSRIQESRSGPHMAQLPSRLRSDRDFQCFPSFDLGFK